MSCIITVLDMIVHTYSVEEGGHRMFRINQRSAQPIYEQILENVETLIISGALLKDEQLPSVRSVAKDLAVNPNTIQKAYGLLEERGII